MKSEDLNPGRELDALIAEKVMGWKYWKPDVNPIPERCTWAAGTGGVIAMGDWSPSTSIKAAWEVVEKMSKDYDISITTGQYSGYLVFMVGKNKNCPNVDEIAKQNTLYETAPHAICLAALKAIGVECE